MTALRRAMRWRPGGSFAAARYRRPWRERIRWLLTDSGTAAQWINVILLGLIPLSVLLLKPIYIPLLVLYVPVALMASVVVALRSRRRARKSNALRHTPRWAWLMPPFAIFLVALTNVFPSLDIYRLVAYALGLIVLGFAVRYPVIALQFVLATVALYSYFLSWLFKHNVPGGLLNAASQYKEGVAIAVLIAGMVALRRDGRRLDLLDKLCIAFLVLSLAYLYVPGLFGANITGLSAGKALTYWRTDALGVLILLGARNLSLSDDDKRKLFRAAFIGGAIVAASGIWEFVAESSFNNFAVNTIGYPHYETDFLHFFFINPTTVSVHGFVGGKSLVRVGGVLDYTSIGIYLLVPFAILLHWSSARRLPRFGLALMTAFGAVAILTQTRSTMLGFAVAAVLSTASTAKRPEKLKLRFAAILVVGGIAALPLLTSTGALNRVLGHDTASTAGHQSAFQQGITAISKRPLGYGFGSSAGAGRASGRVGLTTENQYLQYGVEAGVFVMGLFIAVVVVALIRLYRAGRADPEDTIVSGAFAGLAGVATAAWFLHVLNGPAVMFTVFGLVGVALASTTTRSAQAKRELDRPVGSPSY